jgi:hypothetical protein
LTHDSALNQDLFVVVKKVGCGIRLHPIGIHGSPKWCVFGEGHRLRRAGIKPSQPIVRSIHVHTAQHHKPLCDSVESLHDVDGFRLRVRNQIDNDMGRQAAEFQGKACQILSVSGNVQGRTRENRLSLASVENCHLMSCFRQLSREEGTDEAGSSNQ